MGYAPQDSSQESNRVKIVTTNFEFVTNFTSNHESMIRFRFRYVYFDQAQITQSEISIKRSTANSSKKNFLMNGIITHINDRRI